MAHQQPGLPFIIDCGAAAAGLGVMLQQQEKQERKYPTCFAGRVLRFTERKWFAIKFKALLSCKKTSKVFRVYVERSFTLMRNKP